MSDLVMDIMGALPDDFVRRMMNWARFKVGSSMGYASVDLKAGAAGGYREAKLPLISGEAKDTDMALQTIEVRYRRAVELFWSWQDSELVVLARRCGGIDKRTYAKYVIEGHSLLRSELSKQHDAARRHAKAQVSASQLRSSRGLDAAKMLG